MKKTYLYLIYILISVSFIGVIGYFLIWGRSSKVSPYHLEAISRGEVAVQVRATGTINPTLIVNVGSQVSGMITKINVDFNSTVRKGQIIAELDTTSLAGTVNQSRANLAQQQAALKSAKLTLTRSTELHEKSLISDASFDSASTAYKSDKAQVDQAQAQLDGDLENLRHAVIRSPIDGVVISRDVDIGQTVASSLSAPQLFSIGNDLKTMQVEASVDEADIGGVIVGQNVTFTVDAYPDDEFTGVVSQVRLSPVVVQNVTTYTVIIAVPNPDLKLRPGMTATITILIDKKENVLRVSDTAIKFQPPQDILNKFSGGIIKTDNGIPKSVKAKGVHTAGTTVQIWMLDEQKQPRPVAVTLGLDNYRFIEISGDNVKEGDSVIVGMESAETGSLTDNH